MDKKRLYIISSTILLVGLLAGIIQYVGMIDALYAAANNPGHSWNQMECTDSFCVDTINSRIGIGDTSPSQALEINGNILASGTGDVCNGEGKCLDDIFQSSAIVGTNAQCPSGQTAIMKAYNGTWYTADNASITSWTKVTCGPILSSDGTALLVNNGHTSKNCTDAGGTVVDDGSGNTMCRFNASTCPSSWTQFNQWSTTIGGNCYCTIYGIYGSASCLASGDSGFHAWANSSAREQANLSAWGTCAGGTAGCRCYSSSYTYRKTCSCLATAGVSQIGCY